MPEYLGSLPLIVLFEKMLNFFKKQFCKERKFCEKNDFFFQILGNTFVFGHVIFKIN
jgi:hypothetical protein